MSSFFTLSVFFPRKSGDFLEARKKGDPGTTEIRITLGDREEEVSVWGN